jgi:hypothetical protein
MIKSRRLLKLLAGCLALAAMAESCGPVVTVQNNTDFTVRAIVMSGESRHVLSPGPGESLSAEAEQGPYSVSVIPDEEWIEWAKAVRDNLNGHLANPQGLSTTQIEEIITSLRDIRHKIQQYEEAAKAAASGDDYGDQFSVCNGTITEDGGGTVSVTHAGGKVFAACD